MSVPSDLLLNSTLRGNVLNFLTHTPHQPPILMSREIKSRKLRVISIRIKNLIKLII